MRLFTKDIKNDFTLIIGCGRLGASIANTLYDQGNNVVIIDSNKDSFRKLNPSFGGLMLTGNATDFDILHEAQIEKANLIIAVTNNDNTNIMISQMAAELYKKDHIIIRIYDPERESAIRNSNIDTICPVTISIKEINQIISIDKVKGEAV